MRNKFFVCFIVYKVNNFEGIFESFQCFEFGFRGFCFILEEVIEDDVYVFFLVYVQWRVVFEFFQIIKKGGSGIFRENWVYLCEEFDDVLLGYEMNGFCCQQSVQVMYKLL